jgi:hypothetical protein
MENPNSKPRPQNGDSEPKQVPLEEIPRDLFTLYMKANQTKSRAVTSTERYIAYKDIINYGSSLLTSKHKDLKDRAARTLRDKTLNIKDSDITYERSTDTYKIGNESGGEDDKCSIVLSMDYKAGIKLDIDKQCSNFLPALISMEKEILDALVDEEVIPRKIPSVAELTLMKIQKKLIKGVENANFG